MTMKVLYQSLSVVMISLVTPKLALPVTQLLFDHMASRYSYNETLAFPLGLRYDDITTLKINHHSVSGSPNCKPPGWPKMSSPVVKMPPHRSKAHPVVLDTPAPIFLHTFAYAKVQK